MEESQVASSDLPRELLSDIGERLDSYIDVIRFRSVCRLWRDSLPKLKVIFPPLLSYTMNQDGLGNRDESLIFRRIIYGFRPVDHDNSVCSKGWLGKIDSANLADRVYQRPIYSKKSFNKEVLKEINLLDFRIEEVAKSYILGFPDSYTTAIPAFNKVIVFPDSNCIIVAINFLGELLFKKHGDLYWQDVIGGDKNCRYNDAIVYKGKIYTVEREGRVFLIDSSMELVEHSCMDMSVVSGDLKHLVECGGELYMVDRFVERKVLKQSTTIDLKVHMLDQKRRRWVEVKNLGNKAFVLGVDCFEGFEGNCIYFSHQPVCNCSSHVVNCKYFPRKPDLDLDRGCTTHVFHLHKRSIMESSLQILRAPLVLLQPANDSSSSSSSSSSKRRKL